MSTCSQLRRNYVKAVDLKHVSIPKGMRCVGVGEGMGCVGEGMERVWAWGVHRRTLPNACIGDPKQPSALMVCRSKAKRRHYLDLQSKLDQR